MCWWFLYCRPVESLLIQFCWLRPPVGISVLAHPDVQQPGGSWQLPTAGWKAPPVLEVCLQASPLTRVRPMSCHRCETTGLSHSGSPYEGQAAIFFLPLHHGGGGSSHWPSLCGESTFQPLTFLPPAGEAAPVARSPRAEGAALFPTTPAEESRGFHSQRYTGAPSWARVVLFDWYIYIYI